MNSKRVMQGVDEEERRQAVVAVHNRKMYPVVESAEYVTHAHTQRSGFWCGMESVRLDIHSRLLFLRFDCVRLLTHSRVHTRTVDDGMMLCARKEDE